MMLSLHYLAEVATVFNGKTPSKAEQRETGFPVLKIKNVSETGEFRGTFSSFIDETLANKHSSRWIKSGDTLILNAAHNANYVASKLFFASDNVAGTLPTGEWLLVRPHKEQVIPEYLHFWLRSPETRKTLRFIVKGIHLYPKDVAKLTLRLPPIDEQLRIVDILSRAEGIVRLRREAQKKAAEIIPALFIDMFGDPGTNPKGWQFVTIGDLVHAAQDGPHVSPSYVDNGIPFISTRHVKRGQVFFQDLKFLSLQEAEIQWKKCKPVKGDILYTKGGTTGIAAEIDFDKEIAVWVHVALLKTNHAIVNPTWLESMLNSGFCYQQSQELTHGIANRDLGLKRMVKIRAYLPPLELQRQFARSVKDIKSIQAQQAAATQKAEATFEALLGNTFIERGDIDDRTI